MVQHIPDTLPALASYSEQLKKIIVSNPGNSSTFSQRLDGLVGGFATVYGNAIKAILHTKKTSPKQAQAMHDDLYKFISNLLSPTYVQNLSNTFKDPTSLDVFAQRQKSFISALYAAPKLKESLEGLLSQGKLVDPVGVSENVDNTTHSNPKDPYMGTHQSAPDGAGNMSFSPKLPKGSSNKSHKLIKTAEGKQFLKYLYLITKNASENGFALSEQDEERLKYLLPKILVKLD